MAALRLAAADINGGGGMVRRLPRCSYIAGHLRRVGGRTYVYATRTKSRRGHGGVQCQSLSERSRALLQTARHAAGTLARPSNDNNNDNSRQVPREARRRRRKLVTRNTTTTTTTTTATTTTTTTAPMIVII